MSLSGGSHGAGVPRARPRLTRVAVGGLVVAMIATVVLSVVRSEAREPRRAVVDRPAASPSPSPVAQGRPILRHAPSTRRSDAPNVYAHTMGGRLSPAVRGVRERVYVPDSSSSSVTVIDPKSLRIIGRFQAGSLPQHVTPSYDLKHLYVDNTGGDSLTVVDPRTGRPTGRTIPVTDPYNLYFTPDGRRAVVVAERYSRLDFRDPTSWRLVKSVPIPGAGPDHLDFSANGRYLLLSTELSGDLFRVDTTSMRVTGRLHVGGLPVDVRLAPDGSELYVANQGDGGVSIVDARRMRQIGFLHTGAGAHGLAVSRDDRFLYVSNRLAGTISVISFRRRQVVATWRVGASPDMMQVSPDGRELWASNRFDGTVSVIRTSTGRLVRTIRVGGSPHGLALFPQPGRYSLGHNGVYR